MLLKIILIAVLVALLFLNVWTAFYNIKLKRYKLDSNLDFESIDKFYEMKRKQATNDGNVQILTFAGAFVAFEMKILLLGMISLLLVHVAGAVVSLILTRHESLKRIRELEDKTKSR